MKTKLIAGIATALTAAALWSPAGETAKETKHSAEFYFDETCGIDAPRESHMRALTIRFDDAITITTSCKAMIDGKEIPEHPTTLKRVES